MTADGAPDTPRKKGNQMQATLELRHLNDIRDLVGSLNGYDVDGGPHEGSAWLTDGAVKVVTDQGCVGEIIHTAEGGWMFEPWEDVDSHG